MQSQFVFLFFYLKKWEKDPFNDLEFILVSAAMNIIYLKNANWDLYRKTVPF